MNAVIAVQLARAGFTASHTAFDDPEGLAKALLQDRSLSVRRTRGLADLQTLKPYASCLPPTPRSVRSRYTQPPRWKKISTFKLARASAGVRRGQTNQRPAGRKNSVLRSAFRLAGHTYATDFCAARLEDPLLARLCSRVG